MIQKANNKLLIGALLTGVSLLSGNAVLLTVAGGVGVNWTSEGLSDVWQRIAMPKLKAGTPLELTYRETLSSTVDELRQRFQTTIDQRTDGKAFGMLKATFNDLVVVETAYAHDSLHAPQAVIDSVLPQVLYGHDERQVAFITRELLPTACRVFQHHLLRNHEALTEYDHWLLMSISANMQAFPSLNAIQKIIQQLQQPSYEPMLNALQTSITSLEHQIQALHQQQSPTQSGGSLFKFGHIDSDEVQMIGGNRVDGFDPQPDLPVVSATPPAQGSLFDIASIKAKKVQMTAGSIYSSQHQPAPKQAIVAAFSNTTDLEPLRLRAEAQILQDIVAPLEGYSLTLIPASGIDALSQALSQHNPVIVHLSGHGRAAEYVMEGANGTSEWVDYAALMHEFGLHSPPLMCVLLNACYSAEHLQHVPLRVPFVVAMHGDLNDSSAIEFTRGFYQAMATGATVPEAYEKGRNRIKLKRLADYDVPQLFVR